MSFRTTFLFNGYKLGPLGKVILFIISKLTFLSSSHLGFERNLIVLSVHFLFPFFFPLFTNENTRFSQTRESSFAKRYFITQFVEFAFDMCCVGEIFFFFVMPFYLVGLFPLSLFFELYSFRPFYSFAHGRPELPPIFFSLKALLYPSLFLNYY